MRPREDSSTPDIVFDIGEQDLTRCEFSASSSYFKGIVETAFAVAIDDAIKAMDIPPHMAWKGIEDDQGIYWSTIREDAKKFS